MSHIIADESTKLLSSRNIPTGFPKIQLINHTCLYNFQLSQFDFSLNQSYIWLWQNQLNWCHREKVAAPPGGSTRAYVRAFRFGWPMVRRQEGILGESPIKANGMSAFEAAVSLTKVCVGSGVLALPAAVQRGGLIFSPLALLGIALWNGIAVDMMIECKRLTSGRMMPPGVNSTYSRIAYSAYGTAGVQIADSCLIVTLLGVCVTYLITASAMMQDILGMDLRSELTVIIGILLYPLACVEDVQKLTGVNLVALFAIMVGIVSLFWFGLTIYGENLSTHQWTDNLLYPASVADFTYYCGVSSFCFGMCSLVFPVEESMRDRRELNKAVSWAIIFVVGLYSFVGDGLYLLYKYDGSGIRGNILQNLPMDSIASLLVRASIVGVCVLSFPFTFLPPAQMIEQRIMGVGSATDKRGGYQPIPSAEPSSSSSSSGISGPPEDALTQGAPKPSLPKAFYVIRAALVALCTILATVVPCFGAVVSLLGSFTVTVLTFVLPPVCHLSILRQEYESKVQSTCAEDSEMRWIAIKDISAMILGAMMCVVGTSITFGSVLDELESGC
jgi:amino acid permease